MNIGINKSRNDQFSAFGIQFFKFAQIGKRVRAQRRDVVVEKYAESEQICMHKDDSQCRLTYISIKFGRPAKAYEGTEVISLISNQLSRVQISSALA